MLVGPLPYVAKELIAGEVSLLDALLRKFVDYLGLGGDGGVVGAGDPEGVVARHARAAYEDILNGVVQHVAHMEHARDVGWWDHHGIRLARVWF